MGSDWMDVSLSEVSERIGDGLHGTPNYSEHGEYPFINGNNLESGSIIVKDATKRVSLDEYLKHKKELTENTVLVSINGTIGNVALYAGEEVVLGKSACYVNLKDGVSKHFIKYVLSGYLFQEYIQRCSTGSTIKNVSLKMMRDFRFKMPETEAEQLEVIQSVNSIDDKIALNRQINQTLEQMAQTIFKSWFVDFDPVIDNALDAGFFEQYLPIPDELKLRAEARKAVRQIQAAADKEGEVQSGDAPTEQQPLPASLPKELRQLFPDAFEESPDPAMGIGGWVPKGWRVAPTSSLIELIGGGTPKTSEETFWGGDIPWFSVVDAPNDSDVFVLNTEKKVTEAGIANSSTKMLRVGTTIISARGTVGKCAIVSTPMAMNQSCYGVVGTEGVHDYFVYYLLRQSVKQLQQRSHGSVFSTITRDTFNSLKFPAGDVSLTQLFGSTVTPWFHKILSNNQQKNTLERLRDTLLPKLISGELRLDDVKAETADEEVTA
jgi:type I restriction enzyme S subunit